MARCPTIIIECGCRLCERHDETTIAHKPGPEHDNYVNRKRHDEKIAKAKKHSIDTNTHIPRKQECGPKGTERHFFPKDAIQCLCGDAFRGKVGP